MKTTKRWITTGIFGGTLLVTSIQLGNMLDLEQPQQEMQSEAEQPKITMVSNAKITYYKTTYNGKAIATKNKSISVSGKYLVPANEVLKRAGATVSYSSKTNTLTIKAGTKTTTHKQGTDYVYVNNKKTFLSAKSMVHKGVTMVPYDLVSKSTSAKVTVSSTSKTIKVTKTANSTPASNTNSSAIKTKYQGHDYGADNQTQYDKTIKYVDDYINGYAKDWFRFGDKYTESYKAYFKDGAKAPAKADYNMSDYQYGLVVAEGFGKDLRANKVDYNTIIKLDEVGTLAQNILADANYRDYGASKDMYSAYQLFFEHRGDCDSRAHAMQVVFDKYGFTTQVKYSVTHADLQVKIEGHWYVYDSGSYQLAK